jgi:hypothetical protein
MGSLQAYSRVPPKLVRFRRIPAMDLAGALAAQAPANAKSSRYIGTSRSSQ